MILIESQKYGSKLNLLKEYCRKCHEILKLTTVIRERNMKMKIDNIVIEKVEGKGKVKAYVSLVLNECFSVHEIRIIDGNKGLLVAMPSRKKSKEFKDICHPITQDFRNKINREIIAKYKELEGREDD